MRRKIILGIIIFAVSVFAGGQNDNNVESKKPEKVVSFLKTGINSISDSDNDLYAIVLTCTDFKQTISKVYNLDSQNYKQFTCNGNTCASKTQKGVEDAILTHKAPVLLILGHTDCKIISDVTDCVQGHSHHINNKVNPNVRAAVKRAKLKMPNANDDTIRKCAIEENVWQTVKEFFVRSQLLRLMHKTGKVKVIGAIYDEKTSKTQWLKDQKVDKIFKIVESIPSVNKEQYAARTR